MKKIKNGKKPAARPKVGAGMPIVNQFAAGIDIGDTQHNVAFVGAGGGYEEHEFGSFTGDLAALVSLLVSNGVKTVAMEATGVYYVPLYIMLEEAGIEPVLVNARHCKNVTGRKADDSDAVWIQRLHACGLLRKSFQPDEDFRVLREYVRHRKGLITSNSDSVRRMQKALELMNVKIHTVISDILGKAGMAIIAAILSGERDAGVLAGLRSGRMKASEEEMRKSLEGIWRAEHLFMLAQAHDEYQFRLRQIKDCEERIVAQLTKQVAAVSDGDVTALFPPEGGKKKAIVGGKPKKNQFDLPIEHMLKALAGVNLCAIPGMGEISVLEFLAETGTDMSKWGDSGQFAAWLNVVPNTKRTGGKIMSTRMLKKKNAAGQTLRMAGQALWNEKSRLGDYYRKMKARSGGKAAVLASAHKLARIIFKMLKEQTEFSQEKTDQHCRKYNEKRIKKLEKELAKLKMAA